MKKIILLSLLLVVLSGCGRNITEEKLNELLDDRLSNYVQMGDIEFALENIEYNSGQLSELKSDIDSMQLDVGQLKIDTGTLKGRHAKYVHGCEKVSLDEHESYFQYPYEVKGGHNRNGINHYIMFSLLDNNFGVIYTIEDRSTGDVKCLIEKDFDFFNERPR